MIKLLGSIFLVLGCACAALAQETPASPPVLLADQVYFRAIDQLRTLPEPAYMDYTFRVSGSVLRKSGTTIDHVIQRTSDGVQFLHVISENGSVVQDKKNTDAISDAGFGPDFMMLMQRNAGKKAGQTSIFGLSLDSMATPEPNSVRAVYNSHYAVRLAGIQSFPGCAQNAYHLTLRPRRDATDNPVREMFVDTQTFNLCKVSLGVMLNEGPLHAPVTADVTFAKFGQYWLADHLVVSGRSRFLFISAGMAFDVAYSSVAFPASEPAWLFDRKLYAQHEGHEAATGYAITVH